MAVLPPGTLLQLMYLRERLKRLKPGEFIEIGPGSGEITRLLLDLGWSGSSYDLETKTIEKLKQGFVKEVEAFRYVPVNDDFLLTSSKKADLVISCMVMEHLDDAEQISIMKTAAECLNAGGIMIAIVPASPQHWGIEDDIAGHYRRYTIQLINELAVTCGWELRHISGLTYPLSNLLLPVSNFLVNKSERSKLDLSLLERTKQSGRRQVKFKTYFPSLLGIVLNEYTLYPFYLLQKLFAKAESSLVLYFEVKPISGEVEK